jgi:8-oxo-dGTP pyrophosphatase MutT (NUDIX family)
MANPTDNRAYRFPVSIKGVVFVAERVVLLENERAEWELPGGKLELGETPGDCCAREIEEELSVRVRVERLLDSWVYTVARDTHVLIVTYGCRSLDASGMKPSHEHRQLALFGVAEIDALAMPEGYKASIRAWASLVADR